MPDKKHLPRRGNNYGSKGDSATSKIPVGDLLFVYFLKNLAE